MGGQAPSTVQLNSATDPGTTSKQMSDAERQRAFLRANGWWLWTAAWAVIAVGYLWVHDPLQSSALYDAFAIGAVVAIAVGLRTLQPRDPSAWALVGVGIALLALGDLAYSWLDFGGEPAFPSIADIAYLAGYAVLAVGVFLLFRKSGGGREALIDTAVFVLAGGLVLWTTWIGPSIDPTATALAQVVALAYPAMDLVLLSLLVRLLVSSAVRSPSINLLAIAIGMYLVADVIYAIQSMSNTYVTGVIDLGWLLGYTLFGAAALHPSVAERLHQSVHPAALTRRRLLLLASTALLGPTLLLVQGVAIESIDPMPVVTVCALMYVLIVIRLAGVVRAQRTLLEERGQLQQILRRQAVEDPLTELPNRRGFLAGVGEAVAHDPAHTAVMFVDLDDFKTINDAHGHLVGDGVLRLVAERLAASVRGTDQVGRLGGDEFAVLVRSCPSADVAVEAARRLIDAINAPAEVRGIALRPSASVGVAIGGRDTNPEALMRDADLAMYRAKALGKGRYELFNQKLYADALRTLGIRNDLALARERGQLELHYQPIVSLATGAVEAFEALLRWRHPQLGLIMPNEFLPLAEASGAIVPIGKWVLGEACAAASAWQSGCCPGVGVNVNISPLQLASTEMTADVREAVDDARLSPRSLTLELTEMAVDDPLSAAERLAQFRSWGVTIAIDDFGTGFSSLSRVRELPVQELKIDRSLIESADEKLAAAVIQLGKALGLRLIVEGVETQEQLERVRLLGCDSAQGYLLGRPMPRSALPSFIEAYRMSHAGGVLGAPVAWSGGRFTSAPLPRGAAGA